MLLRVGLAVALAAGACGGDEKEAADDTEAAATESDDDSTTGDTTSDATSPEPSDGEEVDDEAIEPCGLVSEEEMSAIMGTPLVAEEQPPASGAPVCHWLSQDAAFFTVRLTIGDPEHYELLRSNLGTDLPGLGEEAWFRAYESAGVPALDIGVRTADHHVLLFLSETSDLAIGTAMTEAVLEALEA